LHSTIGFTSDNIWLLVDTSIKTIDVIKGQQTIASFENIAIGRGGAGFKEQVGDDVTPLGTYKIGWVNRSSSFRIFFGFDYPSTANAEKALNDGLISRKTYKKIINAHNKNKIPPQNTAMGGMLGIHGLGRADKLVHGEFDWTHGCIAMTNPQIDSLSTWIRRGTVVKVK
jgi:murein L,D-transpeptidase YafK